MEDKVIVRADRIENKDFQTAGLPIEPRNEDCAEPHTRGIQAQGWGEIEEASDLAFFNTKTIANAARPMAPICTAVCAFTLCMAYIPKPPKIAAWACTIPFWTETTEAPNQEAMGSIGAKE